MLRYNTYMPVPLIPTLILEENNAFLPSALKSFLEGTGILFQRSNEPHTQRLIFPSLIIQVKHTRNTNQFLKVEACMFHGSNESHSKNKTIFVF